MKAIIMSLLKLVVPEEVSVHSPEHHPKDEFTRSSFIGFTGEGRYVHRIRDGRATYDPRYYSIDGEVLGYIHR